MVALVVDDTVIIQLILRKMLEALAFRVEVAADGLIAINKFAAQRFDLVIVDYHMPNMTGADTVLKLRRIEIKNGLAKTLICASTSHPTPEIIEEFKMAGADQLLPKPIPQDMLSAAIFTLIAR